MIFTVLHHCLEAWETGEYITLDDFNHANAGGELLSSKRHHSDADKPAKNHSKAAIAVEGFPDVHTAGNLACHAGGYYPKERKGRTEGQTPKGDRICSPRTGT